MIYKIKFVKGSDSMTEKISEYYVLYCYDDGTYMSSFNYWTEEKKEIQIQKVQQ